VSHRTPMLLVALATLACDHPSVSPVAPTNSSAQIEKSQAELSTAPLIEHVVSPPATDPAINAAFGNHYAWLDSTAKSNHRLLVVLPGTAQAADQFLLIQKLAARLGYHVIGLSFPTSPGGLAKICPLSVDPSACFENARLELLDGIDRSPDVNVSPANGIDNRLIKLLQHLVAQYPEEKWSQYVDEGGPKWPLIALAGLSLGGGEAAMIAKLRLVDRVMMFSSVPDSIGTQSAPWVVGHVTPANRYFGLVHEQDGFFLPILAAWDSIGMRSFGGPVQVETSEPPYGGTHMLMTNLTPVGGFVGLNAHGSTATDKFTQLDAAGVPRLLDAWRYMLTASPRQSGN